MLVITSPSKTQDFSAISNKGFTQPVMQDKIQEVVSVLKNKSTEDISSLMKISKKLAEINFDRFKKFSDKFNDSNSKAALFAFKGDVYSGIEVDNYSDEDLEFAQKHLRIISGLYGILRPLDLMQPYRLEMGTKISIGGNKNLYEFWGDNISQEINKVLGEQEVLVNLASQEYSQAVDKKTLAAKMVNIDFKENKNGDYKTIGLFAKRARGKMINFIIRNKINDLDSIKKFDLDGYKFNNKMSNDSNFCFTR